MEELQSQQREVVDTGAAMEVKVVEKAATAEEGAMEERFQKKDI